MASKDTSDAPPPGLSRGVLSLKFMSRHRQAVEQAEAKRRAAGTDSDRWVRRGSASSAAAAVVHSPVSLAAQHESGRVEFESSSPAARRVPGLLKRLRPQQAVVPAADTDDADTLLAADAKTSGAYNKRARYVRTPCVAAGGIKSLAPWAATRSSADMTYPSSAASPALPRVPPPPVAPPAPATADTPALDTIAVADAVADAVAAPSATEGDGSELKKKKSKSKKAKSVYAVAIGRDTGVFKSHKEYLSATKDRDDAIGGRFLNSVDATAWLAEMQGKKPSTTPWAYAVRVGRRTGILANATEYMQATANVPGGSSSMVLPDLDAARDWVSQ